MSLQYIVETLFFLSKIFWIVLSIYWVSARIELSQISLFLKQKTQDATIYALTSIPDSSFASYLKINKSYYLLQKYLANITGR